MYRYIVIFSLFYNLTLNACTDELTDIETSDIAVIQSLFDSNSFPEKPKRKAPSELDENTFLPKLKHYKPSTETSKPINSEIISTNNVGLSQQVFNNCPDELALHIFAYLRVYDAVVLRSVSQKWQALLNDQTLWKGYALRLMLIEPQLPDYAQLDYYQTVKRFATAPLSFVDLGTLNNGEDYNVNAISSNGKVIVGYGNDGPRPSVDRAFAWQKDQGMQSLGVLTNGYWSDAYGVSGDGHTIVGSADDGEDNSVRAFSWTADIGMQSLGVLNQGETSYARGVSTDGYNIIGSAKDGHANNVVRAFNWTAEHGLQSLGTLNGGDMSTAYGISANGQTVVGAARDGNDIDSIIRAFRWTTEHGMQSLGTLIDTNWSEACAVSGDGNIIVGGAKDDDVDDMFKGFIWTTEYGMQSIQTIIATLLPSGWEIMDAVGISRDGTVIVGNGSYLDSCRVWRMCIPRLDLLKQERIINVNRHNY